MYILIIPSEEFVPANSPLQGIFQLDQSKALKENGFKLGVLSISISVSLYDLLKRLLRKLLFLKEKDNYIQTTSLNILIRDFFKSVFTLGPKLSIEDVDGITVYRVRYYPLFYGDFNYNSKIWVKAGLIAYKEYVKSYGKPLLIHAHNALNAGLLSKRINENFKIPFVLTEHDSRHLSNDFSETQIGQILNIYKMSSCNMVVSTYLGNHIANKLSLSKDFFKCMPNLIGVEFEDFDISSIVKPQDSYVFLSIGNLIPIKNHDLLLRAFHRTFANNNKVKLKVIGSGILRKELEKSAVKLGIKEQVDFLGELKRDQLIKELARCSSLVHTSQYETFGVVLIEALSLGKPVISTACGGPNYIVNEDNGILVEVSNLDQLAFAMKTMHDCISNYDSLSIRRDSLLLYNKNAFLKNISKVYESIQE